MSINDLVIDAYKTLGQSMFLTEVRPVYEYRNGTRTDTVSGYKYFACRKKDLEKVAIKIPGKQLIEAPADGYIEVKFTDLELSIYMLSGQPQVSATASGISQVGKA